MTVRSRKPRKLLVPVAVLGVAALTLACSKEEIMGDCAGPDCPGIAPRIDAGLVSMPPDGGDSGDAEASVPGVKPSPDGKGVCCPLTAAPGCNPSGYFGGWATSAADCHTSKAYDGCPSVVQTDAHGCEVIISPGNCKQACGAADGGKLSDDGGDGDGG